MMRRSQRTVAHLVHAIGPAPVASSLPCTAGSPQSPELVPFGFEDELSAQHEQVINWMHQKDALGQVRPQWHDVTPGPCRRCSRTQPQPP
jgi:hypothetical protein